jgi:hypothetical protein
MPSRAVVTPVELEKKTGNTLDCNSPNCCLGRARNAMKPELKLVSIEWLSFKMAKDYTRNKGSPKSYATGLVRSQDTK